MSGINSALQYLTPTLVSFEIPHSHTAYDTSHPRNFVADVA